jgi:hypothetical protein
VKVADPASAVGPELARRSLSGRLPRPWLFPLIVFGIAWILILASWQVSNLAFRTSHGWYWYFWYKDAGYYGNIARHWYAQRPGVRSIPDTAAFFPVFPAAIWLASFLTDGNTEVAGLIVNVLAGAAATTCVWALAARVADRQVADRAVLLFAAFPGAMTLGMMYSEPLGIALAAGCLIAVLGRRWVLAGLLAGIASGEHPTLIVLTPVLAVCALQAIVARREWRALAAPLLAPLGLLAFFGWLGTRWHDYDFWSQVERRRWGAHFDFGSQAWRTLTWSLPNMSQHAAYFAMVIILIATGAAGIAVMLAARRSLPVSLFTVGVYASLILSGAPGPLPRYVWAMLGMYTGFADRLPRWLFWPLLGISAAALCFLVGWWPHHPLAPHP